MNKPRNAPTARPLAAFAQKMLADAFARQGFASTELIARWPEIAGPEIAAHAEPLRIQWRRMSEGDAPEPGTLVLRVEGPAALEIQHQSKIVLERVNRFFGWQAVGKLALRQAPLTRRVKVRPPPIDPQAVEQVEATLGVVEDEGLRHALGKLGAAVKRP